MTTGLLAEGAVTAAKIGTNAVTTEKIEKEAITAEKIKAANVKSAAIEKEAINAIKVSPATVPTTKAEENKVQVGTAGVPRSVVALIEGNGSETKFKIKHSLESRVVVVTLLTEGYELPVTTLGKASP